MSVRQQRLELADLRAMEEQGQRADMHGLYGSGKHFYGAGATPSMGLSQFRGGKRPKCPSCKRVKCKCEESSSDEGMEGGNKALQALLGAIRTGARGAQGAVRGLRADNSWIRGLSSSATQGASNVGRLGTNLGSLRATLGSVGRTPSSLGSLGRNPSLLGSVGRVPSFPALTNAPSLGSIPRSLGSLGRAPPSLNTVLGVPRLGSTSTALVPRLPTSTTLTRFNPSVAPRGSLDLVPYVPPRGVPSTSTALTTGLARPSFPRSYYENLLRNSGRRPATGTAPRLTNVPKPTLMGRLGNFAKGATASRIATALALGIPLASLGVALGMSGSPSGAQSGAYFPSAGDDEEEGGEGGEGGEEPVVRRPKEDDPTIYDPAPEPEIPYPTDEGGLPAGMTEDDLAWYLESGRLPAGMSRKLKKQMGGRKKASFSNGRSARAQIVAKVMRERGVSLPQASKIVKQEGLY